MQGARTANTITVRDGTLIHYLDWGHGVPVVFSHGWPLSADAWEDQMLFLAGHGYRVIAHDRRGHGRSRKPWHGNGMDTYADDLAVVLETLGVEGAIMAGHSTGRVNKAALVGAVTPQMMAAPANPDGVPMSVFDGIRAGVRADRAQFFKDLTAPFYGANREGSAMSQGVRDTFWLQGMQASLRS